MIVKRNKRNEILYNYYYACERMFLVKGELNERKKREMTCK